MKAPQLVLLAILVVACGPSSRDNFGDDDGSNGSGSGSNPGGGCSSDLHDVTDANGNVIATCPDDQGCAAGQCVGACEAAAASQGSVGCDFTVATPSFFSTIAPPCFAVFLANNWPKDAVVTISRGGTTYDAAQFGRVPNGTANAASWPAVPASGIASSDVGVLFLGNDPTSNNLGNVTACPVPAAVATTGGSAVYSGTNTATGLGTAFHITTSFPVSAYDIQPYGGASSFLPSAELLLPTTAWGTNYVTAGPQPTSGAGWGQILASADNTTVMITPKVALPAGTGVAAAPANATTTYTLNAGQYVQWQSAGDMAGSVIQSNNPVSFTDGTTYLCLSNSTSSGGGCDSGHQLVPPVSALGSEYVAPPYATRRADLQEESIHYRIVGAADGTTLSYNPAVTGAPASINLGQVVEFDATGAFTIDSQDTMHPFYVGQYMTGCEVTSGSRPGYVIDPISMTPCLGDEEYVDILPPAQWLSSYVFFTDPTYPETELVVVRNRVDGAFADVTLGCAGALGGWQPIGANQEWTRIDLVTGNFTDIGACSNGRHEMSSTNPFGVTVWGWGSMATGENPFSQHVSYAYPGGAAIRAINEVVVQPQ